MENPNQFQNQGHKSFSYSRKGTKLFHIVLIVIIGIAAVLGVVFLTLHARLNEEGSTFGSFFSSKKPGAQLALASERNVRKVGEMFEVDIVLAIHEQEVVGTDIQLSYNPSVLKVEMVQSKGGTPEQKYLQTEHSIFKNFIGYESNEREGRISFAAMANPGEKMSSGGEVATIKFKTVGKGRAELKFIYEPKVTTDTNVAADNGTDVLNGVDNLRLTVE
jgi:hypothetical protein